MKDNSHKKRSEIDKFARRFYRQNARLRQLRSDKYFGKRKERRYQKLLCRVMENHNECS